MLGVFLEGVHAKPTAETETSHRVKEKGDAHDHGQESLPPARLSRVQGVGLQGLDGGAPLAGGHLHQVEVARVQLRVRGVLVLGVNLARAQRTVVLALKQKGRSDSDPGTGLTDREASGEAMVKPLLPFFLGQHGHDSKGTAAGTCHPHLLGPRRPFRTSPE